jgi:hypothetical protein
MHSKFQNSVDTMPKGAHHITLLYHQVYANVLLVALVANPFSNQTLTAVCNCRLTVTSSIGI